jgi:putative transposase
LGPTLPAAEPTRTIDTDFQVVPDGDDDVPLELPYYETEDWDD